MGVIAPRSWPSAKPLIASTTPADFFVGTHVGGGVEKRSGDSKHFNFYIKKMPKKYTLPRDVDFLVFIWKN